MEQSTPSAFTADEFIAWAQDRTEGRLWLDNGVVVAKASGRLHHSRAKRDATIAIHNAIHARGVASEVLPDGASVRVNDRTVYEPNALVRCGAPAPRDTVEVSDPVVVVEVVSPFSRGVDAGAKLASYFSLSSVSHHMIIDTQNGSSSTTIATIIV